VGKTEPTAEQVIDALDTARLLEIEYDHPEKIVTFPPNPETYFLDKKVRVEGKIEIYKGTPEIVLDDPSQIWIVE
jgi:DNA/RNA endonuclease YhcR with UshA esterase domain